MSKARKALTCLIPILLLLSFAAYAVFSPRAELSSVIGAAAYLILFTFAALACVKNFLSFFKDPEETPPSALLGERSKKRLHPVGKIIFYSLLAQLLFIIIAYILNNLINGFRRTVFNWYGDMFISGAGGIGTAAILASEKFAVIPFLPEFLNLISRLTGIGIELPAFILNTLAITALSVVLYELMLFDFDKKAAVFAVVLLFISPAAVYMMLPLSGNAFFLLFMLLMNLLLRKGKLFFGGLFAMLAATVNCFGFLLFIPLLIEGIRACILAGRVKDKEKNKLSKTVAGTVFSLFPLLILLASALIYYFHSSEAALPIKYLYPEGFRFFFEAFKAPAESLMNGRFTFSVVYQILPLLSLGIVLICCLSKIRASYALACMLLFAFTPTLFGSDMIPFASALFPVLPVLFAAKIKTKKLKLISGIIIFIVQLVFVSTMFVKGGI